MTFDPTQPLGPDFREAVGLAVSGFLTGQRRRLDAIGPEVRPLLDQALHFTAGGKRFRPAFCYWGYVAAAGEPADEAAVIRAAGSLDLLHVSALAHDDVMDGSATRRGGPASHVVFAGAHSGAGWRGDSEVFGRAGAILLGDLLLMWSAEMWGGSGLDAEALERARPYLDALRTEVTVGQYLDIVAQAAVTNPGSALERAARVGDGGLGDDVEVLTDRHLRPKGVQVRPRPLERLRIEAAPAPHLRRPHEEQVTEQDRARAPEDLRVAPPAGTRVRAREHHVGRRAAAPGGRAVHHVVVRQRRHVQQVEAACGPNDRRRVRGFTRRGHVPPVAEGGPEPLPTGREVECLVQQRPYLRPDRVETPPLAGEEARHGQADGLAEVGGQRLRRIEGHGRSLGRGRLRHAHKGERHISYRLSALGEDVEHRQTVCVDLGRYVDEERCGPFEVAQAVVEGVEVPPVVAREAQLGTDRRDRAAGVAHVHGTHVPPHVAQAVSESADIGHVVHTLSLIHI